MTRTHARGGDVIATRDHGNLRAGGGGAAREVRHLPQKSSTTTQYTMVGRDPPARLPAECARATQTRAWICLPQRREKAIDRTMDARIDMSGGYDVCPSRLPPPPPPPPPPCLFPFSRTLILQGKRRTGAGFPRTVNGIGEVTARWRDGVTCSAKGRNTLSHMRKRTPCHGTCRRVARSFPPTLRAHPSLSRVSFLCHMLLASLFLPNHSVRSERDMLQQAKTITNAAVLGSLAVLL
ncbi:hypothetical protein B0J12DRAFT_321589 [Macrophomina phaseolina]|uniref:Uncharacterized protein n=1 Tax=Macrophomina phaseolina TaxID=35725 RepID=A0ABQ8FVW8_9PEZI|nr:hypothetical protein B0J12DRAFT_321589 [Macrophomina phaseolina]